MMIMVAVSRRRKILLAGGFIAWLCIDMIFLARRFIARPDIVMMVFLMRRRKILLTWWLIPWLAVMMRRRWGQVVLAGWMIVR